MVTSFNVVMLIALSKFKEMLGKRRNRIQKARAYRLTKVHFTMHNICKTSTTKLLSSYRPSAYVILTLTINDAIDVELK